MPQEREDHNCYHCELECDCGGIESDCTACSACNAAFYDDMDEDENDDDDDSWGV